MTKEELEEKLSILNKMILKRQSELQVLVERFKAAQTDYLNIIEKEFDTDEKKKTE